MARKQEYLLIWRMLGILATNQQTSEISNNLYVVDSHAIYVIAIMNWAHFLKRRLILNVRDSKLYVLKKNVAHPRILRISYWMTFQWYFCGNVLRVNVFAFMLFLLLVFISLPLNHVCLNTQKNNEVRGLRWMPFQW